MRVVEFFDTSVLVAAAWRDHPGHAESVDVLSSATPDKAYCSAHSLAETYASLTSLPIRPPIRPEYALLFIEDIRSRLSVVGLTEDQYYEAVRTAADRNILGAQLYDRLHIEVAAKCDATTIYTWNMKHFQRLAPEFADRIRTP